MKFQNWIAGLAVLTALAGCSSANDNTVLTPTPTRTLKWRLQQGSVPFIAVWGSSGSDVFAVGPIGTSHYNGHSWSRMNTDDLDAVWGTRAATCSRWAAARSSTTTAAPGAR